MPRYKFALRPEEKPGLEGFLTFLWNKETGEVRISSHYAIIIFDIVIRIQCNHLSHLPMEKGEWGGWFFFARCKHSHHHHPYSMQSSSCQGQCKPYPIHPITWQFVFYWILTHILNHWGSNEFWMKYINDQYLLCISSLILNVYHLSWMLSILAWIYHHCPVPGDGPHWHELV